MTTLHNASGIQESTKTKEAFKEVKAWGIVLYFLA